MHVNEYSQVWLQTVAECRPLFAIAIEQACRLIGGNSLRSRETSCELTGYI
jgi:hypothetical protein